MIETMRFLKTPMIPEKRNGRNLNHPRGFTLIEMLMVLGMMSLGMVQFMSMMDSQKRAQKGMDQSAEFTMLKARLNMLLSNSNTCLSSFQAGISVPAGIAAATVFPTTLATAADTVVPLFYPTNRVIVSNGAPIVQVGNAIPPSQVDILALNFVPGTLTKLDATSYKVDLILNAKKSAEGAMSLGAQSFAPTQWTVMLQTAAASAPVTRCSASLSESAFNPPACLAGQMIMGFDAVTNTWKCLPESPCGAGDRLEVQGDGSVDCIAGDPPAGETMMIFKGGPP